MLTYDRLSKKPLLFKSFTGFSVQQFDNIYNEEITKRYDKHEIQHLSSAKRDIRERKIGAGRPFKLDLKDRFVVLLVYYRLYITYTLAGFLFDLDQKSNICRYIQKIDRKIGKTMPIDSTKDIQHN
ncbi:MAG: helix-turn-helix domain-containing protein [Candidatus Nitrosocosmicus sp.]